MLLFELNNNITLVKRLKLLTRVYFLSKLYFFCHLTSDFRLLTSDSRLHIKCTPERTVVVAALSTVEAPVVRATTAIVVKIASSMSTRESTTATSVSTVLCSPFKSI